MDASDALRQSRTRSPVNGSAQVLPAATRAYDYVKAAIIKGDFASGTLISEGLVCQQLDISRTPAHEAFLRLAAENLLNMQSRKGAIVRPIAPSEAEDVLQMREAIESAAAARVIRDGLTTDLLPQLKELIARQEEAVMTQDVDQYLVADDLFHTGVVEASGNRIAVHFTYLLHDRQQRLRHQLMRVRPAQLIPALAEHKQLLSALTQEDSTEYAAVLRQHVLSHNGAL
ncbi:UNVERIFIED_CONTAM: GntR family transcriptional regulator [Williamsia faeni]